MSRLRGWTPSRADLDGLRDSVLRAVALVVTDRRCAAPLSAMALGFGLFLGVAIGPGADGSLAGASQILAVAAPEPEAEPIAGSGRPKEPMSSSLVEPAAVETPAFETEALGSELAPEPLPEAAPQEVPPSEETAAEGTLPEETEAQQMKGTVVHANPAAESYTLAIAGGELVSLHAAKLPTPGTKLAVEAELLENNTFAEVDRERSGATTRASFRGVVTYVDPDPAAPAYVVSGRGSSIVVQVPPESSPTLPGRGAYVTVGVEIAAPTTATGTAASDAPPPAVPPPPSEAIACLPDPALEPPLPPSHVLVQRTLATEPEPATYVDLAGVVSAVCPSTRQMLISADDTRGSEADLLLSVPSSIKTAMLTPGESVVATATIEADGTLTLAGLASDEGAKGAEGAASAQGDLKR